MSSNPWPTTPAHLSRPGQRLQATGNASTVNPLYLEQFGGDVQTQFIKASMMNQFVPVKTILGTDTLTNDRVGTTALQAVVPGVRPDASVTQFDNISIKVDTIVLARNNVALLDDFQNNYDVRSELAKDQGKVLGRFYDEAFLIQAMKAARIVAAPNPQSPGAGETALPPGFQSGTVVTLAAVDDEEDPDLLQKAIEDVCQGIEEKDVDLKGDGGAIFVKPAQFYTLLRNDRLLNGDYSTGNGDYAKGMVMKSCGLPIFSTNRMPSGSGVTGHLLSNAGNSNAYDYTAAQGRVAAIVMLPKALLAGQTIPMTSKVYYDDKELSWFIDSYFAFGVTPNRAEHAGVVDYVVS